MKVLKVILLSYLPIIPFLAVSQLPSGYELTSLDGQVIKLEELKSEEPTMIYFWTQGCSPCIVTFNAIKENAEEWERKGFKMIAIAVMPFKETYANKIRESEWPFEIYFSKENRIHFDFQTHYLGKVDYQGFPQAYLFDTDWSFVKRKTGGRVKYKDQYLKDGYSKDLLKEKAMEGHEYHKLEGDLSFYYAERSKLK